MSKYQKIPNRQMHECAVILKSLNDMLGNKPSLFKMRF